MILKYKEQRQLRPYNWHHINIFQESSREVEINGMSRLLKVSNMLKFSPI